MQAPTAPLGPPNALALLPWIDDATHASTSNQTANAAGFPGGSIQLDPNAPPRPRAPLPLAREDDLRARADRLQAEQLLQSKDLRSGDHATEAMRLLLDLPPDQRAKAIDALDPSAFENLLDRVPEDQRERFAGLVNSSQDPKRRLRLWAEAHKSRAGNDLARYQGDFGEEVARTDDQERRLARYERREAGVMATNAEVDREVGHLLSNDKGDQLTITDVDALRQRKDLELQIETENNLNLTAETASRADGSQVFWSRDELQQVRAALAQLPDQHIRDDKTFETLHRAATRHFTVTKKGEYLGDRIDIYDTANLSVPGSGGGHRAMVSDQLRREHGDTVGTLEYAVTHEIGHDVEADHPEAFEKFKNAAGWKTIDAKGLRESHLDSEQLEKLEQRRRGADPERGDVRANGKVYTPAGHREYHQVDDTAIPSEPAWRYAKTNPREHFAEVYAKAAQDPETLYRDLVEAPSETARTARAEVEQRRLEIVNLRAEPSRSDPKRLQALTAELANYERDAADKEKAEKQRSEQFRVMRNDVFGTDKALTAAVGRLRAQHTTPEAIRAFEQRAARASTPAQVAALEREVTR